MKVLRDSASIRGSITDPTLTPLIQRLIEDLSEYEQELSELVHIVVVEPGDEVTSIDAVLGFSLLARPLDVIEVHPGWFELTFVMSDDGFGFVVYVPVEPGVDARLIAHCRECFS